jgi:hypothetical protein
MASKSAISSVVNGVLLEPLEYAHPGPLVKLELLVPKLVKKFPMISLNPATYLAWSHEAKSLAAIGAVDEDYSFNLTGTAEPDLLSADAVSPNLFDVSRNCNYDSMKLSELAADSLFWRPKTLLLHRLSRNRSRRMEQKLQRKRPRIFVVPY